MWAFCGGRWRDTTASRRVSDDRCAANQGNGGPRLAYRIAMGVRFTDQDWKRLLNRMIEENQPDINKLLLSYGVPLLDDNDRPVTEGALAK